MAHEKDEVWGTTARRTLRMPAPRPGWADAPPESEASAFGPEAVERAQMMAYERNKRIQQESPYVAEEVVEHVVHDHRLYVGMWITAGVSAVGAFLTFSLACLITTCVALVFALSATPGRQTRA